MSKGKHDLNMLGATDRQTSTPSTMVGFVFGVDMDAMRLGTLDSRQRQCP